MIAAPLSTLASSLPTAPGMGPSMASPLAMTPPAPQASVAHPTSGHHFATPQHHDTLPSSVDSFYTMGPDVAPVGPPPVSTAPSMSMESSNLFKDLPQYLQQVGGPSDPTAMLAAQVQMTQATLNWTLYGQMASKAVSGLQSLFNNQV